MPHAPITYCVRRTNFRLQPSLSAGFRHYFRLVLSNPKASHVIVAISKWMIHSAGFEQRGTPQKNTHTHHSKGVPYPVHTLAYPCCPYPTHAIPQVPFPELTRWLSQRLKNSSEGRCRTSSTRAALTGADCASLVSPSSGRHRDISCTDGATDSARFDRSLPALTADETGDAC